MKRILRSALALTLTIMLVAGLMSACSQAQKVSENLSNEAERNQLST